MGAAGVALVLPASRWRVARSAALSRVAGPLAARRSPQPGPRLAASVQAALAGRRRRRRIGGGGMAADFARAPVSTDGRRRASGRQPALLVPQSYEGETPPRRLRQKRPPLDLPSFRGPRPAVAAASGAARDSAAAATAGGDGSGPGLSATPTRRDDEPEE